MDGRRCVSSAGARWTSRTSARCSTDSTWGSRSRRPGRSVCSSGPMISADEKTRASWAESLRASPVLCHLAEDQLRRLIGDGQLEQFPAGAELIHADTQTSAVYLVVGGACDVQRSHETVRLNAPALVGEIAALTG